MYFYKHCDAEVSSRLEGRTTYPFAQLQAFRSFHASHSAAIWGSRTFGSPHIVRIAVELQRLEERCAVQHEGAPASMPMMNYSDLLSVDEAF